MKDKIKSFYLKHKKLFKISGISLFFVLLATISILCIHTVDATVNSVYVIMDETEIYGPDGLKVYTRKILNGTSKYATARIHFHDSDGNIYYCVQPNTSSEEGNHYTDTTVDGWATLSDQGVQATVDKTRLKLIMYYGYGYTGRTDEWYSRVTQVMVWSSLYPSGSFYFTTTTSASAVSTTYDAYIAAIEADIATYYVDPSFNNTDLGTLEYGQSVTLTDTNGVLQYYTVSSCTNASCSINGNTLTVTATGVGSISITLTRAYNRFGTKEIYVYTNTSNSAAQKVTSTADPDDKYAYLTGTAESKSTIYVNKVDGLTGSAISGATICLYSSTGTELSCKTSNGSTIDFGSYSKGSYYVQEKSAASEYVLNTEKYTITVDGTGTSQTVTLKNYPYSTIYVDKLDSITGAAVSGATICLYSNSGTELSCKTSNGATINFGKYDKGTYYIQEKTAATGYVLNTEKYYITVDGKGTNVNQTLYNTRILYNITTSVDGTGGTITGDESVYYGDSSTPNNIVIQANDCYQIKSVTINGTVYSEPEDYTESMTIPYYTFMNQNIDIVVEFEKETYTITTTVDGTGGTITGTEVVYCGCDSTENYIEATADHGYQIKDLTVDGDSYKTFEKYTTGQVVENFTNVREDHKVVVTFETREVLLTVRWIDIDNNISLAEYTYTKQYFDDYSVSSTDAYIDSYYELVDIDGEESGTMTTEVVVTYSYSLKDATVTTTYLDFDTNDEIATQVVADYKYGDSYETSSSDEIPENYEFVSKTSNYAGVVEEDDIQVIYYYRVIDSDLSSSITKSGTDTITSVEDVVEYNITYNASINNYIGDGVLTIVDTLPYKIDELSSNLDGGSYDADSQTITWTFNISDIYAIDDTYDVLRTINISLYYLDIDASERSMDNHVAADIVLDNNETTTENDYVTYIQVSGDVIVHYYLSGTTESVSDDESSSGLVGEAYNVNSKDIEGYFLVESPESESGTYIDGTIELIYYYSKYSSVSITKTNLGGTDLVVGATIQIYMMTEDEDVLIYTGITDETGSIYYDKLLVGEYYFIETNAPEGYILNEGKHYFSVTADGIDVVETFTNEVLSTLVITKKDLADEALLEGATICVYTTDGELVGCVETNADGEGYIYLGMGSYYYVETIAPEGYYLDEEIYYFDITEEGSVLTVTVYDDYIVVEAPNTEISNIDLIVSLIAIVGGVILIESQYHSSKRKKQYIIVTKNID